jgi:alkaline phosphatase
LRASVACWLVVAVGAANAGEAAIAARDTDAGTPRNVVLMIADGCGFPHVAALSLYLAGRLGATCFESFPVRLAMATPPAGAVYDTALAWRDPEELSRHVTDSAAAITAMTVGVKTFNKRLCVDVEDRPVVPLVARMEAGGRATGVVTSVLFAHATPAGCAVSHPDRSAYAEIASSMIDESRLDVIMGAGHPDYGRGGRRASSSDYRYVGGEDAWRRIQAGVAGGDADGDGRPDAWTLIEDRADFQRLAGGGSVPRRVLGIARVRETLQQQRAGDVLAEPFAVPLLAGVPTLAEMSSAALAVLAGAPNGFFLMIEGGAVDWACHDRQPGRMIEEMVDFHVAVEAVVAWIESHGGWRETLLIVTADHECGYLVGEEPESAAADPQRRVAPAPVTRGRGRIPQMHFRTGEHTAQLVPLYARGPGSEWLAEATAGVDPVRGAYLDNTDLGRLLVAVAETAASAAARP